MLGVILSTRERVHERAGYQCEYMSQDGTRCRSRTGLEIEHLRPFALYGSHDEKYLRLFCQPHNRLNAEKVFGAAFIQEKTDASRREASPNGRVYRSLAAEAKEIISPADWNLFKGSLAIASRTSSSSAAGTSSPRDRSEGTGVCR